MTGVQSFYRTKRRRLDTFRIETAKSPKNRTKVWDPGVVRPGGNLLNGTVSEGPSEAVVPRDPRVRLYQSDLRARLMKRLGDDDAASGPTVGRSRAPAVFVFRRPFAPRKRDAGLS